MMFNTDYALFTRRRNIESQEKWDEWSEQMPSFHFDEKWAVQIIPPVMGAMARFRVSYNDASVSVYIDCFNRLALSPRPYMELYPYDGDVKRYPLSDEGAEELVNDIRHVLEEEN